MPKRSDGRDESEEVIAKKPRQDNENTHHSSQLRLGSVLTERALEKMPEGTYRIQVTNWPHPLANRSWQVQRDKLDQENFAPLIYFDSDMSVCATE